MARVRYATLLCLAACSLLGCSTFYGNMEVLNLELRQDCVRACELTQEGIRQYRKGHVDRAETLFQKAISADETYGPAHNNLGSLYFEQRDLYRAAWAFERAAQFMPDHAEPLNNLGLTYETAGRLEEAIGMYSSAVEVEPTNPEYLGNLMRARVMRGDQDDSVWLGLRELLFIDKRPEWIEWAEDQLVWQSRETSTRPTGTRPTGNPDAKGAAESLELLPTPRSTGAPVSHRRRVGAEVVPAVSEAPPLGELRYRVHDGPPEAVP
jgi:tetratricopeptide (TPR) repeat protein